MSVEGNHGRSEWGFDTSLFATIIFNGLKLKWNHLRAARHLRVKSFPCFR